MVLSVKSIFTMIRLKSVTALTPQLGDVKADGQKLSGNASDSSNHGYLTRWLDDKIILRVM